MALRATTVYENSKEVQRSRKDFNPSTLNGELGTSWIYSSALPLAAASSLIEEETVKFR
jgi:hypothetical protein